MVDVNEPTTAALLIIGGVVLGGLLTAGMFSGYIDDHVPGFWVLEGVVYECAPLPAPPKEGK